MAESGDPAERVPTVFSTRSYLRGPSTAGIQTLIRDLDHMSGYDDMVKDMKRRLVKIQISWRECHYDRCILYSVQSLDRLTQLEYELQTKLYIYFKYWIYIYYGCSLRSISNVTFRRLSRQVSFCRDHHLLEAWNAFRIAICCLKRIQSAVGKSGLSVVSIIGVDWTFDKCNLELCQTTGDAALALIRYAAELDDEDSLGYGSKERFVKAGLELLIKSLYLRRLVSENRSYWDLFLLQRIYIISGLSPLPYSQQLLEKLEQASFDDDMFAWLEKVLLDINDSLKNVVLPEGLFHFVEAQRPRKLLVNVKEDVPWWLMSRQESVEALVHGDEPVAGRNGGSSGCKRPESVANNVGSPGLAGPDSETFHGVRHYEVRLSLEAAGQISDDDIEAYFKEVPNLNPVEADFVPGSNVFKNRVYHARMFQYLVLDRVWRYSNCRFTMIGPKNVPIKGSFRDVFDVDLYQYGKRVAKRYRDGGRHLLRSYLEDVRTQAIARYYASMFNDELEAIDKYDHLSILSVDHVQVFADTERKQIIDLFNVEEDGQEYRFEKFTNNWGYLSPGTNSGLDSVDFATSFSHYTYKKSNQKLIVTDLQGFCTKPPEDEEGRSGFVLTDPAMHCPDKCLGISTRVNLEQQGIDKFFRDQHPKCNQICENLQLSECRPGPALG